MQQPAFDVARGETSENPGLHFSRAPGFHFVSPGLRQMRTNARMAIVA